MRHAVHSACRPQALLLTACGFRNDFVCLAVARKPKAESRKPKAEHRKQKSKRQKADNGFRSASFLSSFLFPLSCVVSHTHIVLVRMLDCFEQGWLSGWTGPNTTGSEWQPIAEVHAPPGSFSVPGRIPPVGSPPTEATVCFDASLKNSDARNHCHARARVRVLNCGGFVLFELPALPASWCYDGTDGQPSSRFGYCAE
eukprot:SAG22_NODE_665_length_8020_cov_22.612296_8_plen_199_part_00